MKALLDTHIFLWWITDDNRLTDKIRKVISDGRNVIYLSAVSCWEIAIKYQMGRVVFREKPESLIPSEMIKNGIKALPIEISHTLHVYTLPPHHRDPFDRLLISQAILEDMPILTTDPVIKRYDVTVIS